MNKMVPLCSPAAREASEPLCWRKVENTAGLTVAAADLIFWKGTVDSKDINIRMFTCPMAE